MNALPRPSGSPCSVESRPGSRTRSEIRSGRSSGSIELLGEAPGLSEEDRQLCGIVQREAGRLNQLVEDMLDLARPRKPQPASVDVAALARDVVALAAASERSGAGDVEVRYRGPSTPVWATCDAAQMRQVLWNLVRNGVQASGAGSSVIVSIEDLHGRIAMTVSDSGPGIAPASRAKLFDAFFTTRSQGAGIGLAVVRRIIDDHAHLGVTIDVRSGSDDDAGQAGEDRSPGAIFEVGLASAALPGTRTPTSEPLLASVAGVIPGENERPRSK